MPDQPPTPSRVEELLRASAQRRRAEFDAAAADEGGQPVMPPTMRRRLHEEVLTRENTGAAVAAEPEAEREPGPRRVSLFTLLFAHFWQRFALVAAAVVALIAVPFFWRASHHERLANVGEMAAGSPPARTADSATAAAAPPQEPATVASAPAPPPPAVVLAPSPTAAPVPEPATLADARVEPSPAASAEVMRALVAAKPSVTLAQKDATTTTPAEGLASGRAEPRADTESGLRQSFARNESPASSSRARAAAPGAAATAQRAAGATRDSRAAGGPVATASADDVLSNFRLEQTGDRVRIVDADGSVYTGEIQPLLAVTAAAPATTKPTDRRLAAAPAAPAAKRAAPESQPTPAVAPSGGSVRAQTQQQGRSTTDTAAAQSEASSPRQKQENFAEGRGVAGADAGAAFSFRASGANVSLRKPVVFEGTYYPALNPEQGPAAEANLELKKNKESAAAGSARGTQNRAMVAKDERSADAADAPEAPRVIGRARVAGREVSVDASAVVP